VRPLRPWVPAVAALGLFGVWSNSFIAVGYLQGVDGATPRFDWIGLTVARFVPAALLCAAYCFAFRPAESWSVLRGHFPRLLLCGFLSVPGYNLALNYGQGHGVSAPVASLTTTLVPLFVMALAAIFLGERMTLRRLVGFVVAVSGMILIGSARLAGGGATYPLLVAITALAPFSWSIYSVITKPMTGRVSPVVWTYLSICLGTGLVLPFLPGRVWRQWSELDTTGWLALLYLSVPCTVLGFAVWNWLLRHLPASSVGFTVFLNPPLTTISKALFAALMPATFLFTIQRQEWIGGGLTLLGMAIALYVPRRRPYTGASADTDGGSRS
jgi:drug/metabolite transporter (DMT)-like permease